MRLSVLDFDTPGSAVNLAGALDDLGYHRYWLGEHHSHFQCANPLLLGSLIAATTQGIRIGSGGVCLTYHSPYRVAEDARMIEFLLPDRFDLGVTRGLLHEGPLLEAILDGHSSQSLRGYREKFADLHGYVTGRLPAGHPLVDTRLYLESGPPLWLLGIGIESARLAAEYGTGFCFSLHHSPQEIDGVAQVEEYRRHFRPSPEFPAPEVIVVASCICAATEEAAREYQMKYVDNTAGHAPEQREKIFRTPMLVGTAEQCGAALAEIRTRLQVEEIMIVDLLGNQNYNARIEMYHLLAQEHGLTPRSSEEPAQP